MSGGQVVAPVNVYSLAICTAKIILLICTLHKGRHATGYNIACLLPLSFYDQHQQTDQTVKGRKQ